MTHVAQFRYLLFQEWFIKIGPEHAVATGQSFLLITVTGLVILYVCYRIYVVSRSSEQNRYGDKESATNNQQTHKTPTQLRNPAFPPGEGPNDPENKKQYSVAHSVSRSPETDQPANHNQNVPTNSKVNDSEMEFNWREETGVDFADIGGMEDLKDELRTEVIKPLENPEKAEELGVTAPNVIFYGPPGTGKTYTAEALATELGLPFAMLSGADVQSKWINESATKVNQLFTEAQEIATREGGAVVFLDEIDSVLKNRGRDGSSHEEDNKVVNEFLNHLEDTKDHNVVFIGATNRLDALDDAGIRSGRIDLKIHVGKPDAETREAILHAQLDDREHEISEEEIAELAAATNGAVAADLELLMNRAAKNVLSRDGDVIKWSDIARSKRHQ